MCLVWVSKWDRSNNVPLQRDICDAYLGTSVVPFFLSILLCALHKKSSYLVDSGPISVPYPYHPIQCSRFAGHAQSTGSVKDANNSSFTCLFTARAISSTLTSLPTRPEMLCRMPWISPMLTPPSDGAMPCSTPPAPDGGLLSTPPPPDRGLLSTPPLPDRGWPWLVPPPLDKGPPWPMLPLELACWFEGISALVVCLCTRHHACQFLGVGKVGKWEYISTYLWGQPMRQC